MKARLGLKYLALRKFFNEGQPTHVKINMSGMSPVKKKKEKNNNTFDFAQSKEGFYLPVFSDLNYLIKHKQMTPGKTYKDNMS